MPSKRPNVLLSVREGPKTHLQQHMSRDKKVKSKGLMTWERTQREHVFWDSATSLPSTWLSSHTILVEALIAALNRFFLSSPLAALEEYINPFSLV